MRKFFALLLLVVVASISQAAYTPSSTTTYTLADGVVYKKYIYNSLYGGYQEIFVLEVDLSKEDVQVGIGIAQNNKRASTSSMGARYGAIAAVNLGFFNMATPSNAVGLVKSEGRYYKSFNGTISSYTEGYFWVSGKRAGVATPSKFNAGMAENIRWGYPILVQKGVTYPALSAVTSDSSGIILSRRSRTAIGVNSTRQKLYMVVVDEGGSDRAVTCKELADYMINLGCYEAWNADGGGSSTMWTSQYGLMNRPAGGTYQRPVYDILYVRAPRMTTPENNASNPTNPGSGTLPLAPKGQR